LSVMILTLLSHSSLQAQEQKVTWSNHEKPIADQIGTLRSLPDNVRARTTKNLGMEIRQLPATPNKLSLAGHLAMLSTEGDFGHDMLQEVATTLAAALQEQPIAPQQRKIPQPYIELAQLATYEHVHVKLDDPQYAAALAKMTA